MKSKGNLLLPLVILGFGSFSTLQGQLIWSDEFDTGTAPDSAIWSYDLGSGGWGNSELQEYTSDPSNVRVEGGNLIITAQKQLLRGNRVKFTSARIKTENKLTFTYGTIEARIKLPDIANGLWPAFWTLGNNFSTVGWPGCGELDVMEMGYASAIAEGIANRRVGSTAHWDYQGNYAGYGLTYDASSDLNGTFHIFTMDWTPTMIRTYINGILIWEFDISNPASFGGEEFHHPHFIILNLAVGGSFPNIYQASGITAPMPAEMVVDYVRIFNNGFTVLGGSSQGGGNGGGDPGPGATSMTVNSITPGTSGGGPKTQAAATIVILDNNGSPVSNASVTATFSGSHNGTITGTTGSNGSVQLITNETNRNVSFTVCIDSVSHSNLIYDAINNVETCDSL